MRPGSTVLPAQSMISASAGRSAWLFDEIASIRSSRMTIVAIAGATPVPSISRAFFRTFIVIFCPHLWAAAFDSILPDDRMTPQTARRPGCGGATPIARETAMPQTRLCVPCSEQIGGNYLLISQAENLAKAGSLKKNYGDYKLARSRRHIEPKRR